MNDGTLKFLVVVSRDRRLSFMSMYKRSYVLVWADMMEDVIGWVQRGVPVDAILLDGAEGDKAANLRKSLPLSAGPVRIGVVSTEDQLIFPDGRADFLIRDPGSSQEVADTLDKVLRFAAEGARHS